MSNIKIGVVGFGYWGPNLVRNLCDLPGAELVAIAELKENRLAQIAKTYPGITTTRDYQDLFAMGLDAVVIATPPTTHYAIARECMEHDLHILVEKPLTLTGKDADHLCELSSQKGLVLMVGHTFEFNAAVNALKKLITDREIGDLYYIDTARLNLGLFQKGLNVVWDLAPHDISIINFILDSRPVSVSALGTSCVVKDVHDVAYLNLYYPGGLMAHTHVSWLEPCKVRRVTVVGSKKMVVYNDIESLEKIKIFDKGVDVVSEAANFGEFQCSYRYGDILIPNIRFPEPLRVECQHFLDCIVKGIKPISCGEDGRDVVKVLEAAHRSLCNSGTMETIAW